MDKTRARAFKSCKPIIIQTDISSHEYYIRHCQGNAVDNHIYLWKLNLSFHDHIGEMITSEVYI